MSGAALAVLSVVRAAWPASMPDPTRLVRDGSAYVAVEYRLVGRALLLGLFVSCGLAWLAYRAGPHRTKTVSRPYDTMWTILHESVPGRRGGGPAARVVPVVELRTRDRTLYRGQVAAQDPVGSRADRMIALASPVLVARDSCEPVRIDKPWERLLLPMDEVVEMYVAFAKSDVGRETGDRAADAPSPARTEGPRA